MFLVTLLVCANSPNFVTFLLQQSMWGVAFTCLMLSLQKMVGEIGGELDRAVANFSLFGSLGSMIGPVLSGFFYEHYGFQACTYINMILVVIALASEFFPKSRDKQDRSSSTTGKLQDSTDEQSIWSLLLRDRNLRNVILIGGLVLANRELFVVYFPLLLIIWALARRWPVFLFLLAGSPCCWSALGRLLSCDLLGEWIFWLGRCISAGSFIYWHHYPTGLLSCLFW